MMNKNVIIEKIAEMAKVSKRQSEDMLESLLKIITDEMRAGRKINLVGFGSFESRIRHARGGINPQNPTEKIKIPAVRVAKFRAGKTLKDSLKSEAISE